MHALPRRIGLFGGSFDPPHLAHLALARCAVEALALDELRWIPAGQPWQKGNLVAPAEDRVAMVQALVDSLGDPRQRLDRREIDRAGPSRTLDTLRELQAEQPGAELWLLIGEDQLRNFPSWHGAADILAAVHLAVAPRPAGADGPPAGPVLPWPPALQAAARLHKLPMPVHPAASTALRAALAAGRPAAELSASGDAGSALLAAPVARYIDSHRLYRGL